MHVLVNGERQELSEDVSLAELILKLNLPPTRVAVELNRQVVRRSEWPATNLSDGDQIEIVHFVGGGRSI